MQTEHKNQLKELNFTDKEQEVYLSILKLGRGSVVEISKESKIERTTANRILFKFEDLGLVEKAPFGKRFLWAACHPRHLETMVKRQKEVVSDLLPSLVALHLKKEGLPKFLTTKAMTL